MSLTMLLLLIALILFVLAAVGVGTRVNLVAAGLAFATLSLILPQI